MPVLKCLNIHLQAIAFFYSIAKVINFQQNSVLFKKIYNQILFSLNFALYLSDAKHIHYEH